MCVYAIFPQCHQQTQLANTLVMVRPDDFRFNEQTGADNEFQQRLALDPTEIRTRALAEFDAMVQRLRGKGIEVLVLEKNPQLPLTPDAVFPNNWFTTTSDGGLYIYPMLTENRRLERRVDELVALLECHGRRVEYVTWLGVPRQHSEILEGTGVMVFDHPQRKVYAAASARCHPQLLKTLARLKGLDQAYVFETASSSGTPIYHTNVMMSVGSSFAVLCSDCFTDAQQLDSVKRSLRQDGKELIEISLAQMEQGFCGNILQLQNREGRSLISMSASAYNGFTPTQKLQLQRHGELVVNPIPTIETIGGGSCRCMMAEIFLPA